MRRLHIGGREARPGWEILDVIPGAHVDHTGDAADLSRFANGTFGEIYASHVLEHFDHRDQVLRVLREWHRVLAPGGRLYLSVPDLERLCHLYLTPRLSAESRYDLMKMFFGAHADPHDFHLCGFDEGLLGRWLGEAGFAAIRRVPMLDLFDDLSRMEVGGMPISLNVIAEKAPG